jgi:hypothetical protein
MAGRYGKIARLFLEIYMGNKGFFFENSEENL